MHLIIHVVLLLPSYALVTNASPTPPPMISGALSTCPSVSARGPTCFAPSPLRLPVSYPLCLSSLDDILAAGQGIHPWIIPDWHFQTADKACNIRFYARRPEAVGQEFSARDVYETALGIFGLCDEEGGNVSARRPTDPSTRLPTQAGPGYGGVSDLIVGGILDDGWRVVALGGKVEGGGDGEEDGYIGLCGVGEKGVERAEYL